MAESSNRQKVIFVRALDLCGDERAAFLAQACGADKMLHHEVEAMLHADAVPDSFLEKPAAALGLTTDLSHGIDAANSEQPCIAERLGTMIGPYKLLQQIGEGGMGVVFMAEQEKPVRRIVALKIIKLGMDTRQVIARFESERQALAMMDHPNIARVLDTGATDTGRPFFVMELVKGIPITKFCEENKLTPRHRLELFATVCQAVQHAHQKGIIHRDLKPSNVLIAMYDDKPVPKVIDFGVAKATSQKLTERTLFTEFGSILGTLEYMSPEQAKLNALDIDTRSDVYALGVLLYELLTGTTPLEKNRLREFGYEEMLRLIREEETPKPSTRLSSTLQAGPALSPQRMTEAEKLTKLLRGELDWIVLKALEKDRTRRYDTASAFARDIERYLKDEPVEACPPSVTYRLQKYARKHKAFISTMGTVAALLLIGIATTSWQAVRATQAEGVALVHEQHANANAVQAQENEQEAQKQRDEAQKQRDEVKALNEKLLATQAELRGTLYAANMNLTQNAWEASSVVRVRELLELNRHKPGDSDLRGFEWHYLYRLSHAELLTLKGHTGVVNSVAYSPDGKRLASAAGKAQKGEVKVWDAQTGQELLTKEFTSGVQSVAFSPDGRRLASAGGGLKVWDAQTGQELLTLKGHAWDADMVAYSPDGKRLASAAALEGLVKVWDAQTGQELLTIKGSVGGFGGGVSMAFSPDGTRLAIAASGKLAEGGLKMWDAQTGRELLTLDAASQFSNLAFSPDGKRLASATTGKKGSGTQKSEVKVWDALTGQELFTLKSGGISVAFSPDSKRLASAGGGKVTVWDIQTSQEVLTLKGIGIGNFVAFSPDGKRLANTSMAMDHTVTVWNVEAADGPHDLKRQDPKGQPAADFKGNFTGQAPAAAFSADGKFLARASFVYGAGNGPRQGEVKVWDALTGQELFFLKGDDRRVLRLAFSPDGKQLATTSTAGRVGEVKVWDVQTGQEILALKGLAGLVYIVAFSPDGKHLVTQSRDNQAQDQALLYQLKMWDIKTGQELFTTLKGHSAGVRGVAFSPDGTRLASASNDKTVKVWDAQNGQELLTIQGHTNSVLSVAFSPDGTRLASASNDKTVKVWNTQTGQELLTIQGHTVGIIGSVAFSPDGKRLASGSADKMVKVWDAQSGQEMLTLKGHTSAVNSVVFSPDGNRLSSHSPGEVKVWDATPLPEK